MARDEREEIARTRDAYDPADEVAWHNLTSSTTFKYAYQPNNEAWWKDINIKNSHEYLGFIIGPQGGNIASWHKAINNYNNAARAIATANNHLLLLFP